MKKKKRKGIETTSTIIDNTKKKKKKRTIKPWKYHDKVVTNRKECDKNL